MKLFELKDIKPQLAEKQVHQLEYVIQEIRRKPESNLIGAVCVQVGTLGKELIVFPSGKMCFREQEILKKDQ